MIRALLSISLWIPEYIFSLCQRSYFQWMTKGRNSTSGKYYQFYQHVTKRNADATKTLIERLNDVAKAGNCQVRMFILERRFPK